MTRQALILGFLVLFSQSQSGSFGQIGGSNSSSPHVETFELQSQVFKNIRTIRVMLPDGYTSPANAIRKYPVLYLNDGFAVFTADAWNAPQAVSDLIRENIISPIVLVGIDNGASIENGSIQQRTDEYLPYADAVNEPDVPNPHGSDYPKFLIKEVMPAIASRYRVAVGPENTGLGGSSYGGMAALYTVMHNPDTFGRMMLESTPLFMARFAALNEAEHTNNWPASVYLGVGTKESPDPSLSREAAINVEKLKSAILRNSPRSRVKVVVDEGAEHSSAAWRSRLPKAIWFLWGREK